MEEVEMASSKIFDLACEAFEKGYRSNDLTRLQDRMELPLSVAIEVCEIIAGWEEAY